MIHSGSRNLGLTVAKHYNNIAKELNKKWYSLIPNEFDMAFLPLDSQEGKLYLREMEFCMRYAKANRKLMMSRTMEIINKLTGGSFSESADVNHNYARMESHFGRNVMVHRKGATSARLGEIGIIPGSQGTSSYIVKGLGNKASLESCSHGAGRKMGRKEACRSLDLKAEIERLNAMGILHAIRGKDDLEEAAGAYKDIDVVISEQLDLIEVVTKLEPLAVIKG
jgi:tRNA-splicing ligase RtcB